MHSDFSQDAPPSPKRGTFMKAGLSAGALLLTGSLVGWSASAIGAGTLAARQRRHPIAAPGGGSRPHHRRLRRFVRTPRRADRPGGRHGHVRTTGAD